MTVAKPTSTGMAPSGRLASVDAYRGFVMFLMAAELLRLPRVAAAFPGNPFWEFIARHTTHVEWTGCSLHDLIQPSFSFLVGVALPFSVANRIARNQRFWPMFGHAVWRALVLVLLGVFLRSVGRPQTYWTFEDTLSQIGLGYVPLFLLAWCSMRIQWLAFLAILIGYFCAWAMYPLPAAGLDWESVGVPADWPYHMDGLARHWEKNANLGAAFDHWWLNLFPRETPFAFNSGGYLTLSFIPTLGTMVLGLLAGGVLRRPWSAWSKMAWLVGVGLACLAAGWALGRFEICPVAKRIWTPSWTLFSGGWCCLLLAGFYGICDGIGWRRWAFPLVVIGTNSITMYCLVHLVDGFILSSFKTHFGTGLFEAFGPTFVPLLEGALVLVALWLVLLWMYKRRVLIRI